MRTLNTDYTPHGQQIFIHSSNPQITDRIPQMENLDIERLRQNIRRRLDEIGESPRAISMAAKLSSDTLGKFLNGTINTMRFANVIEVARAMGVTTEALIAAAPTAGQATSSPANDRPLGIDPVDIDAPQRSSMPLDVPVRGVVVGGKDGFFSFNGTTIDYVRRTERAKFMRNLYALFVSNDSMYPRFGHGELVYVNPDQPPAVGDDVVVELQGDGENEAGQAFIKRLKRRTATQVIVEQFNPAEEIKYETSKVRIIHRVLTLKDLMGI